MDVNHLQENIKDFKELLKTILQKPNSTKHTCGSSELSTKMTAVKMTTLLL